MIEIPFLSKRQQNPLDNPMDELVEVCKEVTEIEAALARLH